MYLQISGGCYTVTIKDGNNCVNTSVVVNIVNTRWSYCNSYAAMQPVEQAMEVSPQQD
ncbi:MAG: hypothetical protein IPN99_06450 [Bacteroidetes bacterium]|nr:hypothetical protein [Bacteroidota bacterium]